MEAPKIVREDNRLNVDIPASLKKRLRLYCVNNDMNIKDFVILFLESTLDDLEGESTN